MASEWRRKKVVPCQRLTGALGAVDKKRTTSEILRIFKKVTSDKNQENLKKFYIVTTEAKG